MPNRSFKEYIANRFYSEFSDAITDYIGDDIDQAELRLFRVQTVGEWEISDIDVQYVSVSDLPGMMIQFDAVVDAEFYVRDANHRTDVDEETHQQFLLRCIGNLRLPDRARRRLQSTAHPHRVELHRRVHTSLRRG